MNSFRRTEEFDTWLANLKDKIGRARITLRIRSAEHGNFGDKSTQKRDIKRAIELARVLDKE